MLGVRERTNGRRSNNRILTFFKKDNWDVNSHVMTRNKYGVFEILVKALAKRKVAIPHGSKVKVKRKLKF